MLENAHLGDANLSRLGLLANLMHLRSVAQTPRIRTTSTKRIAWHGSAANDLLLFEGFDILNTINDPAPNFDVVWADPEITPSFECLVTDLPSISEMILM